ncbi:MAG TPA: 50S ribosomal protein L11 methyltransferase [Bacteroidota bacterium]|nr:50S ribosomal protein L11 methyltransferase [Bacteroidota bacterium]
MSGAYVEAIVNAPSDPAIRELISYHLSEEGFTGFLEDDACIHCFIPKDKWDDGKEKRISTLLKSIDPPTIALSAITEVPPENWNRQWEQSIQPIEVGENFIITPSWHPVSPQKKKVVLIIDPKMSFGTGYHESTRLMLRMIERFIPHYAHILDVGTGTGILAIASAKLKSSSAIGIDTDEWSYTNAKENVERNDCAESVDIRLGSIEVVGTSGFDAVFANITRSTIIELLPHLVRMLAPAGIILLSGIMAEDRPAIIQALSARSCSEVGGFSENEWIGIAAEKGRE